MLLKAALAVAAVLFAAVPAQAWPGHGFRDGFEGAPANRWSGIANGEAYYGFESGYGSSGTMNGWLGSRNNGFAALKVNADVSGWAERRFCTASVQVNPLGWDDNVAQLQVSDAATGQALVSNYEWVSGDGYRPLGIPNFELRGDVRTVTLQVAFGFPHAGPVHYLRVDDVRLDCTNTDPRWP